MCEDFPCCGHERGCCPDYECGRQVNMRCTCGAILPIDRFSLCDTCLYDDEDDYEPDVDELTENEDFANDDLYEREDFGDFDSPMGEE